jgi:hypothetical protein
MVLLLAFGACWTGDNPNIAASGKGKPQMTLDLPKSAAPGSVQTLTVTATNPGPGRISSVFVSFSLLGAPSGPIVPLVPIGAKGHNSAVLGVTPKPDAISSDGDIYRFGSLAVGDSMTIHFRLKMPDVAGTATNSVQVYDGTEPDRSIGMPLRVSLGG